MQALVLSLRSKMIRSCGESCESGADGRSRLYASAEDPSTTTAFTDYFTENGRLAVLTKLASSPDQMIGLKQALLPASGIKHWNHFPNATTVYDDSPARRTYHVAGSIASTFDGGNCSIA